MMKIKKFSAPNIQEALRLIKAEMGDGALILGTSRRRSRGRGKTRVEVVAATGDEASLKKPCARVRPRADLESKEITKMRKLDKETVLELKQIEMKLKDVLKTLLVPAGAVLSRDTDGYGRDLIDAGFDPFMIAEKIGSDAFIDKPALEVLLKTLLENVSIEESNEKVLAFLGPSGSGKTTTVLKVAKRLLVVKGVKPRVIYFGRNDCRDSSWLRSECKRLGVKSSRIADVRKLEKAIKKERKSPILIDTPGISDLGDDAIRFFVEATKALGELRLMLVIESTMDPLNICAIASCIPGTSKMGLVLTKLDEATRIGGAVSAAMTSRIPLAYVTGGKGAGDGIFVPDTNLLSEKILEGVRALRLH